MKKKSVVLAGALMSSVWIMPHALAQTPCVTQNMAVPPGANTSDKAAPIFIDTTGLDFKPQPTPAQIVQSVASGKTLTVA